jgi:cell shape-determining protein MreC
VHVYLPSRIRPQHIGIAFLFLFLLFFPFGNLIKVTFVMISKQVRFSSPFALSGQVKELQKNNTLLTLKIRELESLSQESQKLKEALNFSQANNAQLVGVEVLAFDPSSWRRVVFVDAGRKVGVRVGAYAVDEKGFLVGKVIETKDAFSELLLIDDPFFKLPVFVKDEAFGLLKGGPGGMKVMYVEDAENVKEKDPVWAKVPGLSLPINIGEVRRSKKDPDSLFWDIDVKIFSEYPLLHKIFIIK